MAASDKTLRHHMSQSPLGNNNNDGLNDSPYNSFSSFKSFDNTVVSAYEVGIANGLNGKSAKNSRNRDLPVPRLRKSLARKPPSGAKLEYKPSGTVTKSKSLTEINTINNGSYKLPDRNAERFDNRSFGHSEQTTENHCIPALSSDQIHAGNRYSKHVASHQGNSKLHAPYDNRVPTTCFAGEKSVLNGGVTLNSDENKITHRRSDGLEASIVPNDEGLDSVEDTQNHLYEGDNISVELKDTIRKQSVQHKPEGSLNGTHDLSESISHDFNRKGNSYRLFQRQSGGSVLLTKARKVNGNISGSGRRRSLNDGIELFSSNLVQDDPIKLHGSQLDKTVAGKQTFRNRHHSLKHYPTGDENIEAASPSLNNTTSVAWNESEIPRAETQSGLSRRKLPKVPDQKAVSVNKMAEKEDKAKPHGSNNSDSVISETTGGKQLEHHKDGATNTKGNVQSSNYVAVECSDSDTNIAPKLPESKVNCDKSVLSRTNPPKGLSSRKGSLKEQIMEWKRDSAETQQSASLNKSVDEHCNAKNSVNDTRGRKSGRTRTKTHVSGNIEDKFRNKLKEIVASGSTNNEKKPKTAERKKVNITNESHHAPSSEHLLEPVSCSAITNSDVRVETSPKPDGAKEKTHIEDSLDTSKASNVNVVSELPANSVFSFNQDVIQELTDLVMTKPAIALTKTDHDVLDQDPPNLTQGSVEGIIAVSDCKSSISDFNDKVSETQSGVINMVRSDLSNRSGSSENEHKSLDSSCDQTLQSSTSSEDLNQSQKLHIEGKSFDGRNDINKASLFTDEVCKETVDNNANTSAETKQSNEKKMTQSVKEITPTTYKDSSQKSGHVLRTPSYRKRVMARAKLRYSKKSQNFKECSCVKKESGELDQCSFCQMFEMKKRSQTSLGHSTLGEFSEGECSDISSPRRALTPEMTGSRSSDKGHNSPRSVRKVNVSPRVDVLLSSNLFKKHLQKHENLIQRHTMSYKRFGMNKSVSNLDLSEGFATDTESSYVDDASEMSEPAGLNDFTDDAQDRSTDYYKLSDESPNRRHSLTSGSDIYLADIDHKAMMRKKSGDTLPSSFTKPRSRPGLGGLFDNVRNRTASRNNIPSFHEFRKRKEKESSLGSHANEHSYLDGRSAGEDDGTDNVSTALTGQGDLDCESINHDLQTVLEADEKGSKENLISAGNVTNEDCKLISGSEVQPLGFEKQVQPVHDRSGSSEVVLTGVEHSGDIIPNVSVSTKPQPPLKTKSRTLPSLDSSVMSDNSSDQSSSQSVREKRRISGKRPRSVMSKKSNPDSDTPDTSEKETSIRQNVSARPKLKGHGKKILRSESDSKYETEKGKNPDDTEDLKTKGVHSRHLSLLGKGHNSVTFNLDSTQNDGASDVSSSITESLMSDSMYSESFVNETVASLYDTDDFTDGSNNDVSAALKDDLATSVLRSTSDACEMTHEAARKRRERKERPYKSDPFSGTEIIPASGRCAIREEKARLREHLSFAASSKEEILSFLDGVSQSDLERGSSFPSLEEISEDDLKSDAERQAKFDMMRKLGKHPSNVSSLSTDSGVIGQDESHDSKQSSPTSTLTHSVSEHGANWHQSQQFRKRSLSASCGNQSRSKNRGCNECNKDSQHPNLTHFNCLQCEQRQIERKKIIQEVMDTEVNYGRDLKILLEEFYEPMLKAGLLTKDQLDRIFLNIDELIHVNVHFITKLKAAINYSNLHNDEDLSEVMIGSLFLESSTMFLTFENYCVNQAQAPILLEQLEREKELLKIFLHVSQSDNHLLRRMHLKSFLMVPVQRIMKYPLLLDRLYKVTLDKHKDKEALREAKEKIEDILGHINAKSKSSSIKQRKGSEKHYSVTEKIEVSRVALETLGWNRKDVCDVITTRLQVTQPLDHMWAAKKCKNHKFTTMHGVLLSLVQPNSSGRDKENISDNATINSSIHSQNNNNNNNNNLKNNNNLSNTSNASAHVVSAAVVLIKEKNGRYQVARDPFMLEKCVVSQDLDFMEVFELLEWNRESFLIKAESPMETKTWVQYLRQQMQNLGCWRKRRNALPNILLNHLS